MIANFSTTICRRSSPRARYNRSFSTEKATTALYTWGTGTDGQLGHSKFQLEGILSESYVQTEPRRLIKSKGFTTVAIGGTYTLALNETGHLFAWGDMFGKVKNNTPHALPTDKTFTHLSAGTKHAAAVDIDGQVHTWGSSGDWFYGGGQLGHDNYEALTAPKLVESFQKYGAKAARVSVGDSHTLIQTTDGEILGCGVGEFGRVGTGSTADVLTPTSLDVLMDEDIVQTAAGTHHSLALTIDGKIYTWGKNDTGALGHGDSHIAIYSLEEYPRLMVCAELEDKSVFVAAGSGRSAVITSEGKLYVWGRQLGHIPALVDPALFGGLKVIKVALGGEGSKGITAVITEDDGLWTFGDGSSKMIGYTASWGTQYSDPVRVPLLIGKKVFDVYCGPGQHMIAKVSVDND